MEEEHLKLVMQCDQMREEANKTKEKVKLVLDMEVMV